LAKEKGLVLGKARKVNDAPQPNSQKDIFKRIEIPSNTFTQSARIEKRSMSILIL